MPRGEKSLDDGTTFQDCILFYCISRAMLYYYYHPHRHVLFTMASKQSYMPSQHEVEVNQIQRVLCLQAPPQSSAAHPESAARRLPSSTSRL